MLQRKLVGIAFTVIMGIAMIAGLAAQSKDNSIILSGGEAWIKSSSNIRIGYIFQSDGSYLTINDYDGELIGQWAVVGNGKWAISGNNLTLSPDAGGAVKKCTYTLADNKLTLAFSDGEEVYRKTKEINPDK